MGFFSSITNKVASISASIYMFRRFAQSLPERIEAFKEGDYVTAFLGEKIGSLFKPQDEEETKETAEQTEQEKEICTDIPELPADVKTAMEYDTLVSDASSALEQLNSAAMVSDERFLEVRDEFQKEAAVDTYMNMIMNDKFVESDFYKWASQSTDPAFMEQLNIIADYHQQIDAGMISADDVRATLIAEFNGGPADNPVQHTLSDGTVTSYPPLPGHVTSSYQDIYLHQDDSGITMDVTSPNVSAQYLSEKQAAYSAAIESFTTGYSVEDVITINALQIADVRSATINSVEDEATKTQIANADYKTPLIASSRGNSFSVAHFMRENPDAFKQAEEMNMQVQWDNSSKTEQFVAHPTWADAHSRMKEWQAAQAETQAVTQTEASGQPQRDPALQAETEELANIGQTSTNTVDFGYEG